MFVNQRVLSSIKVVIAVIGLILPLSSGQRNPQSDCVDDISAAGVPNELLALRNRMLAERPVEAVGNFLLVNWSLISPDDGRELSTRTVSECSGCNEDPAEQFRMANETGNLPATYQNKNVQLHYDLVLQWNKDTGKDALATGIVRDQQGQPVGDATVILERLEGGETESTQTGPNGLFRTQVRSGDYRVTAQKGNSTETQRHLLCAYGSQKARALGQKYELPFMEFRLKGAQCWEGSIHIRNEFLNDEDRPVGYTFWDYRIEAAEMTGVGDANGRISLAGSSSRVKVIAEAHNDNQLFSGWSEETSGDLEGGVDQAGNYSLSLSIPVEVVQASYGMMNPPRTAIGWERTIETFMFKKSPVMTGKMGPNGEITGTVTNRFVDEGAKITAVITWEFYPCIR